VCNELFPRSRLGHDAACFISCCVFGAGLNDRDVAYDPRPDSFAHMTQTVASLSQWYSRLPHEVVKAADQNIDLAGESMQPSALEHRRFSRQAGTSTAQSVSVNGAWCVSCEDTRRVHRGQTGLWPTLEVHFSHCRYCCSTVQLEQLSDELCDRR